MLNHPSIAEEYDSVFISIGSETGRQRRPPIGPRRALLLLPVFQFVPTLSPVDRPCPRVRFLKVNSPVATVPEFLYFKKLLNFPAF